MKYRLLSFALILLFLVQGAFAYNIVTFAPTVYQSNTAAMDSVLGVTDYIIEDFEDVNLVDGLTIEWDNPDFGPVSVLPKVYVPAYANNYWDGSTGVLNHTTNIFTTSPAFSQITTFHIANGAKSFGIGLANFQDLTDHKLLVNGVQVAIIPDLEHFQFGVPSRNLYVRIDAQPGETIYSVSIDENFQNKDGMVFDHVAFNAVPELNSILLVILALGLLKLKLKK